MTPVVWRPSALEDLAGAAAYWRDIDPQLALAMIDAVTGLAARLGRFPRLGPAVAPGLRKLSERRFGYVLLYRISDDAVEVIALRHMRQNWRP